jgi:hypothetical protein
LVIWIIVEIPKVIEIRTHGKTIDMPGSALLMILNPSKLCRTFGPSRTETRRPEP